MVWWSRTKLQTVINKRQSWGYGFKQGKVLNQVIQHTASYDVNDSVPVKLLFDKKIENTA